AAWAEEETLYWTPLLRPYTGSHPDVVQQWIASRRPASAGRTVGPPRLRLAHLRLYVSDWVERLTGARLFEYRNYVEVCRRVPSRGCASSSWRRSTAATTAARCRSLPR